MPKKIGKDVINKKGTAIISTPKESEEFEKWQEEQLRKEEEREQKPKVKAKLESRMPEEPEPSADELAKEKAKDYEEMAKWKESGKLKPVHVNEHYRSKPKQEEEQEEEEEET